jgi:hypothetical protein
LLLEQARVIAESELLLRCVRAERIAVIERLRDVTAVPLAIRDDSMARAKARLREFELAAAELEQMESRFNALTDEEREKLYEDYDREAARLESKNAPVEERDEIDAMHEAIPDLNRLARYERRAWSRRKRAMWNFIDIRINEIRGLTGFGAAPTSEIGWRSPWPCPDRQRP